jgi:hypothetical protein
MELLASACVGIGLAAACGARVFLPLFVLALASAIGIVEPTPTFAFLANWWAVAALGLACVLELGAYYIPWIDHAVDAAGAPAAALAGTLAVGANLGDLGPFITWATAAIAGGGVALAVRSATASTRAASTLTTGGLANSIFATIESILTAALAILAVVLPIAAGMIVLVGVVALLLVVRRLRLRRSARRAIDSADDGDFAFDVYDTLDDARGASRLHHSRRWFTLSRAATRVAS